MLIAVETDEGRIIVVDILVDAIVKRHAPTVKRWWPVEQGDLPEWEKRDAWVWDGKKIAIDPALVKAPEKTLEERVAALETVRK